MVCSCCAKKEGDSSCSTQGVCVCKIFVVIVALLGIAAIAVGLYLWIG